MAEYEKGRLYWIKLTDRFMSSDTVDFLMSQDNGANYVVLYQMLCLKTVNNSGVLARELGELLVPYDVEKIKRDCKWFSSDTVRIALELYKKLGLVYENNNGVLAISNFNRLIGSQTIGAEKKALQRQSQSQECVVFQGGGQKGGQKVDICPPDKDKDIDTDINIDIYNKQTTTTTCICIEEPPSIVDVHLYFKNNDVPKGTAYEEANKFICYNNLLGWKCLPEWQKAADLWISRINERDINK